MGRRLTNISATQQLPMCQLGFDFSSEAAGHCIISKGADPVSVPLPEPSSHPNAPPPPKDKPPADEEDPYEKIDISASKASTLRVKGRDLEGEEKLAREVAKQLEKKEVAKQLEQKANAEAKWDRNGTKSELTMKLTSDETGGQMSNGNSKNGTIPNETREDKSVESKQKKGKRKTKKEEKLESPIHAENMSSGGITEKVVLSVEPSALVQEGGKNEASIDENDDQKDVLVQQENNHSISQTPTQPIKKETPKEIEQTITKEEVIEEICFETKAYTTTEVDDHRSRSKSKTKKFAPDDLETLRTDFARKQGVKGVVETENAAKELTSNDKSDNHKNGSLQKKENAGDFEEVTNSSTSVQHPPNLTRTVSNKSESESQSRSKSQNKSKKQKFAADDLEAMRAGFASKQGVKEVKIVKDLPTPKVVRESKDLKQNSQPSPVEDEEVFEEIMSPEEAQLHSQQVDELNTKDDKNAIREVDLVKGGDDCVEAGKEKAQEGEYEQVGHPARENDLEKSEQKSQSDIQEEERVKGGVISDIVSDFKDFSS